MLNTTKLRIYVFLFTIILFSQCQNIFNGCRGLAKKWTDIKEFQPGCELLEDPNLLSGSINKIGEPTNTFILRKAFLESGGFDPQFSQLLGEVAICGLPMRRT